MDIQKIAIKLFTDTPEIIDLNPFLSIFARWRHNKSHSAEWVDLADYAHVPKGPGILLIGQQGNLSLDLAEPGSGILWNNKKGLSGSIEDRIIETFRRGITLAHQLTSEIDYPKTFKPRPGFLQLSFNDRLELPNDPNTELLLRSSVNKAMDALLRPKNYKMIQESDSSRRYGFIIHSDSTDSIDQLQDRLDQKD